MKTPNEIKKGLECCFSDRKCEVPEPCPYFFEKGACDNLMMSDALTYIKQLEADNSRKDDTIRNLTELLNAAHEETAAVKRERDAAVCPDNTEVKDDDN